MKGIEVALVGRLAKDAEVRTSKAGQEWMLLPMVVGEQPDEQWVSVSSWSHTVAELAPQLVKGVDLYVEGKLKLRTWQGDDGTTRSTLAVSANLIQPMALIGNRKPKKPRAEKAKVGEASAAVHQPLPFNDDIGF